MNKEQSQENNMKLLPVNYTPEQEAEMAEHSKSLVEALNSVEPD